MRGRVLGDGQHIPRFRSQALAIQKREKNPHPSGLCAGVAPRLPQSPVARIIVLAARAGAVLLKRYLFVVLGVPFGAGRRPEGRYVVPAVCRCSNGVIIRRQAASTKPALGLVVQHRDLLKPRFADIGLARISGLRTEGGMDDRTEFRGQLA